MTQLDIQSDTGLARMRSDVAGRLDALKRRVRLMLVVEGVARTAAGAVGLMVLSLVLDHRLELSRPARWVFLLVSLGVVVYLAQRYIVAPLRSRLDPLGLTAALDRRGGGGAGGRMLPHVAAVMELPGMMGGRHASSSAMIELAVAQSYEALGQVDFEAQTERGHLHKWGGALAGVLLVPVLFALLWPGAASVWSSRWLLSQNTPWPRNTTIVIEAVREGVLVIPRGEPTVVRATVTDQGRPTESVWMRLRHADGRKETLTLTRFGEGDFRYDLQPLQGGATATFWGGDGRTGPVRVEPHDRPRVTSMELSHWSPRAIETVSDSFAGRGDTALYSQSRAELVLNTNVPLSEVRVDPGEGAAIAFGAGEEGGFVASWTHDRAVQAKLRLVAAGSGLVSHPVPVAIGLREDRPPRVNIRFSGVRPRITSRATIPLEAEARDDLGVHSLSLHVSTRSPDGESVVAPDSPVSFYGPVTPSDELRIDHAYEFDVEVLDRSPGDTLTLEAEALDDHFQGPQRSVSRRLVFSIVPDEALFREILLRQQGLRATFRKATDQAQQIEDTLRHDEAVSVDTLSRGFRVLRREVWQVQRDLDASATEMRLNKLGGEEAYDLIRRYVLDPMARLHDQDMDRQRQALDSLDVADTDALADAGDRQAQIVAEMEEILSQMRQWDSFIDVVNQLDEVIKLQEGAHELTDELRDEQLESIFDE